MTVWPRATRPRGSGTDHVGTAALGCPVERSSAVFELENRTVELRSTGQVGHLPLQGLCHCPNERGRSRLHVFHVCRDVPLVPEGIDHAAAAVTVGMILRLGN
jgi:hypothetical protein